MADKKNIEIKVSNDGSHTLYVSDLDEHYHSINGAVNESIHVFIHAGLNQIKHKEIKILEFGFGTGLNALLTAINSKGKDICYHTLEKYPIGNELINELNYAGLFDGKYASVFEKIHQVDWETEQKVMGNFFITKQLIDFKEVIFKNKYHLIYFDAFAPDIQPKLWTKEIFSKAYDALYSGGVITTYCAKGMVRRVMQEVGFKMERLPGPPGKREMLRGIKP